MIAEPNTFCTKTSKCTAWASVLRMPLAKLRAGRTACLPVLGASCAQMHCTAALPRRAPPCRADSAQPGEGRCGGQLGSLFGCSYGTSGRAARAGSLGSVPTSYMWCCGSVAARVGGLSIVERCRSIMDPELISGTASARACVRRQSLLRRYPSHSEPTFCTCLRP